MRRWLSQPAHMHPKRRSFSKAFRQWRKQPVRLMIAPRRPERFNEVASLNSEVRLDLGQKDEPTEPNRCRRGGDPARYDWRVSGDLLTGADVFLSAAVSLIKAVTTYSNQRRPARHVVTGAHTHNFHAMVDLMSGSRRIVSCRPPVIATEEITNVFAKLLASPRARRAWPPRQTTRHRQSGRD